MVIMDRYDHKIQFISVINQFSYSDRLDEHPVTSNQPGATHRHFPSGLKINVASKYLIPSVIEIYLCAALLLVRGRSY
jgi:hypothetical protein